MRHLRSGRRRLLAALLATAMLVAGCGQTGPLYFPDEDGEKEQKKSGLEGAGRLA